MSKRVKITFEKINEGKYKIIPRKEVLDSYKIKEPKNRNNRNRPNFI